MRRVRNVGDDGENENLPLELPSILSKQTGHVGLSTNEEMTMNFPPATAGRWRYLQLY